jgi:hypothetical protein
MKILLFLFLFIIAIQLHAQIPRSGTYIYNYCDEEYGRCLNKCKIKISGNSVWVYAPANLTGIKEGELFEHGTLFKNKSGKWLLIHLKNGNRVKAIDECDVWFDFKRKRFWTC